MFPQPESLPPDARETFTGVDVRNLRSPGRAWNASEQLSSKFFLVSSCLLRKQTAERPWQHGAALEAVRPFSSSQGEAQPHEQLRGE